MNTNERPDKVKPKSRWPAKTLIEILPIIIALTAIFSYSTIKNVSDVALITPLAEVLGGIPLWVAALMGLILIVGCLGMGWLIYIFSRAPIAPDGSNNE
jgi:phosphate/sulfate permease